MLKYDIRQLDYFDTLEDVKRFINFMIIMNGGGIHVYGNDNPAARFVIQNPDMFMFKPIKPDNIPSSGRWLLSDIVKLGTFQIVYKNLKRLFV